MKEPTYSQAIATSWRLAWRQKHLWGFGIFAMLLGQFGMVDLLVNIGLAAHQPRPGQFWDLVLWLATPSRWHSLKPLLSIPAEGWTGLVWIFVLLIGLVILGIGIAVASQGALVYAAARAAKNPEAVGKDSVAWKKGVIHSGRLFGFTILRRAAIAITTWMVIAATLLTAAMPSVSNRIIFLAVCIFAIAIGLIVSFVLTYAAAYVVVEEYRFFAALRAAWNLFLKHPLVSIEAGLVVVAANVILIIIGMAAVIYILLIPLLVTNVLSVWFNNPDFLQAGVIIGYTFFAIVMAIASAIFTVFTTSVWTFLFVRMHRHGVVSHMSRWLRRAHR